MTCENCGHSPEVHLLGSAFPVCELCDCRLYVSINPREVVCNDCRPYIYDLKEIQKQMQLKWQEEWK